MYHKINGTRNKHLAQVLCVLIGSVLIIGSSTNSIGSSTVVPDTAVTLDDSFTFSATPNRNYGDLPAIYVSDNGTWMVESFVALDLSVIPTGSSIDLATLRLFVADVFVPGAIEIYRVLDPWDEATITHNAKPSIDSAPIAVLDIDVTDIREFVTADLTVQVQAWMDGSNPNYGIALVPAETLTIQFDSKETTETSHAPELEIVSAIADDVGVVPSGGIIMWKGSVASIPTGWLLCDGNNGTPDLRDRFVVGAGSQYQVDDIGGEDFHTLTVAEMPSHTHGGTAREHSGPHAADGVGAAKAENHETSATGGGQPHENRPPYYALAYIMKL